jgi:serine/threonine protein kinase/WD40 repeat protein
MAAAPDPTDELAQAAAVLDFVESWHRDQQAGTPRSLAEYLTRCPGFDAAIAREFVALTTPATATADPTPAASHHGPYRLERQLGHGGQGTVWLATDTRLGRQVALKVLSSPSVPALAGRVERLRREALALARLAHPGICAIHEAELDGPTPYLAMQRIEGETLAALLQRRAAAVAPLPLSRAELRAWLEFFRAAALALHAAHSLGIVHRDIKPGNLMRTPDGAPVLLDFGLARDLDLHAHDVALTQSGELFGTLPYMAPELLAGGTAAARTDLYALAVTMYEVLAGRRPYHGATPDALRLSIQAGEATALDQLTPAAGRDVAVVVATAMEREPVRRYATAAAFADDLGRILSGEPIAARPLSHWTRLRRLMVRHPALCWSFVLLALGFVVATTLLTRLAHERTRLLALRQAHLASQLAAEQPGLALFAATEAARTARHPEIQDVLYRVLDQCWEEHALLDHASRSAIESTTVQITSDDRHLVRAMSDGSLQVVDLTRGVVETTWPGATARNRVVLGANDTILVGGADGLIRELDLATGDERRQWTLPAPAGSQVATITELAVAPHGHKLASCGADGTVAILDLGAGGVVACRGHHGGVTQATWSPDGRWLSTVGGKVVNVPPGDRFVRIFDAATGTPQHTFGPFAEFPRWAAWHRDGRRLAIAAEATAVTVHDLTTGTTQRLPHARPAHWVEFTPDGQQLVLASSAGLFVHDAASGELVASHTDFQERSVFRGAFAPDGHRLAVIAWDDTARLYDTRSWQVLQTYRGVMTRSLGLGWNHRGDRLYTVGGCLQSWYVGTRPFLPIATGLPGRLVSAQCSPRGDQIVAASATGTIQAWTFDLRRPLRSWQANGPLLDVRHAASGDTLLAIGDGRPAQLLPADGPAVPLGTSPATAGYALGRDRVALLVGSAVQVHDAASGALRHQIECHPTGIVASALHPSRPWLATGGRDRTFAVVDLDAGTLVHRSQPWAAGTVGEHEQVLALAFPPRGDRLWVSGEDLVVREVGLAPGFPTRSIRMAPTPGRVMASRDAASLYVSAMWSGRLYCYDTSSLALRSDHPARHSNLLVALELQPGSSLALSASKDGVVAVFDADRDELLSTIHATTGTLVTASFTPDGQHILTADAAGQLRLWPLDPLATAERVRPARHASHLRGR